MSGDPKPTPPFAARAMQPLSAQEANRIARAHLKEPFIEPILRHIYSRIRVACLKGEMSIVHPFDGLSDYPTTEQQGAVLAALRRAGYEDTHHPNPDPGHPASRPYTEISWKDAS